MSQAYPNGQRKDSRSVLIYLVVLAILIYSTFPLPRNLRWLIIFPYAT